jgi:hypothetical protein
MQMLARQANKVVIASSDVQERLLRTRLRKGEIGDSPSFSACSRFQLPGSGMGGGAIDCAGGGAGRGTSAAAALPPDVGGGGGRSSAMAWLHVHVGRV